MLLTRAARRKAGLPPPPSLFKDAPIIRPKATAPTVTAAGDALQIPEPAVTIPSTIASNDIGQSSSSGEEEEAGEEESKKSKIQRWVQCEHISCRKWRPLRKDAKIDMKCAWFCSMHPDPTFSSCDIPEGRWKDSKRGYNFSKLNLGQLVWAKMSHFPPWPAIVTPDPWSDHEYVCHDKIGSIYHVEFLGRTRKHTWMTEEQVEPYVSGRSSLGRINQCAPLKVAITEADVLVAKSESERLETCQYIGSAARSEGHKKHPKRAIKLRDGETVMQSQLHTAKPADPVNPDKPTGQIPPVEPTDILKLCNPNTVGSLEKLLAGSSFNLKEFIQTNFTVDSSGVLRLATSPRGGRNGRKVRRKRKGTLEMDVEPSNRSRAAVRKPGRKPRQHKTQNGTVQNRIPPKHPPTTTTRTGAVCKQISPTILDYFGSSATTEGITGNTVCDNSNAANSSSTVRTIVPVSKSPQGDQEVPESITTAEAQALKELEDIEGMLSTFGEGSANSVQSSGKPGETSRELEDGNGCIDSEWVESVLGDINQIDDLIQDLSQGEIMLY